MNLASKLFVPQNKIEPSKPIVHYPGMSKSEEENVIRFFNALAPENPSAIDLPLIVDQGFPVFEKVLGPNKWAKLKKHYCIGFKRAVVLKTHDLNSLLSELRTIENAQFYLHGYRELLEKISKKLTNYPDGMDVVTKCKVLRMYALIFRSSFYFSEDENEINQTKSISPALMAKTNNRLVLPEEMFYMNDFVLDELSDESILYDRLLEELMVFSTRDRKDVLSFCELHIENDLLTSANIAKAYSFSELRVLKYRLFPEPEMILMDLYFVKDWQKKSDFSEIYKIYKSIKTRSLEDFETTIIPQWIVSGSNIRQKEFIAYKCGDVLMVSGENEANRVIRFVEYCARNNVEMPVEIAFVDSNVEITADIIEKAERELTTVNVSEFFAFLKFAQEMGYVDESTDVSTDYMRYFVYLGLDSAVPLLKKYIAEEITAKELCKQAGITAKFEEEEFGLKCKVDPLEVIKNFALEQGYVESEECISDALVSAIIIDGNEELITNFARGHITAEKLANKLKIESRLESMYFSLPAVDSLILENTLLDVKSSRSGDLTKHALTVKLYCYLIDNQVKCGKKSRVIKGNKRLKLSNLKALAQIV